MTIFLVRGNPVDIDVYNVADNVLIECKRTKTKFIDNLGKIGLKFNSETKLPAAVRDIEGRKLQGSLHVVDANVFQGALDRDDILYQILSYVQSNNPQSA